MLCARRRLIGPKTGTSLFSAGNPYAGFFYAACRRSGFTDFTRRFRPQEGS